MALDATVGGASSNSFATRAVADTYFGDRLDVAEWSAASNSTKESALVMATLRLDEEEYVGVRADDEQNLKWPRFGVYVDGIYQDSDAIPRQILEATYELALAIVKDNALLSDTGLEGFQNVRLGELDVTPRFREGGTLPANVERLLRGLKTSSGYTARLRKS